MSHEGETQNDSLSRTDQLISQEIPPGVDRRTFLMRSALIGATAVILDRRSARQTNREGGGCAAAEALSGPECREGGKRPGTDDSGRVLQGGTGPIEFAYHRPDAHHL